MRVHSRILVVLLYATALVEGDGSVRFFEDLYGHDAALERALEHYEDGPPA